MQLPVSIITIGGDPGSGKSTVVGKLVAMSKYAHVDAGGILRGWYAEEGHDPKVFSFQDWYARLEGDSTVDLRVDEIMRKAAQTPNTILEGRMAFYWPTPHSKFSVYIKGDPIICGARVYEQKLRDAKERGTEPKYATKEAAVETLKKRKITEHKRYEDLYKVNIHDFKVCRYDLITDSSHKSADDIIREILEAAQRFTSSQTVPYRARSISP